MIYLQHTDESQTIWVPKTARTTSMSFRMDFHSTAGLEDVAIDVEDQGLVDGYLVFTLDAADIARLTPGEWEFNVGCCEVATVACGVVSVLRDVVSYRQEYEKNVTYGQYQTD